MWDKRAGTASSGAQQSVAAEALAGYLVGAWRKPNGGVGDLVIEQDVPEAVFAAILRMARGFDFGF